MLCHITRSVGCVSLQFPCDCVCHLSLCECACGHVSIFVSIFHSVPAMHYCLKHGVVHDPTFIVTND